MHQHESKKDCSILIRLVCAIVFILYTYLYLSCFQADVLAMAQHVLSKGQTSYSYIVSPLICTVVLYLLQVGVHAVSRVRGRYHALTYFPSFLFLTILTDVPTDLTHLRLGVWWVIVPLMLLLFGGVIYVIRQLEPYEFPLQHGQNFSRIMWVNLAQMMVMSFIMVSIANHDRMFHLRMRMEGLMVQGKYQEALMVGKRSLDADSSLTMLRMACLHRTGEMGEKLFTYPLVGGSKVMLPNGEDVQALLWKMPRFKNGKLPIDYKLCALLLDKDLDQFVIELPKYYRVESQDMPRHYREALTLYTHRRENPRIVYHHSVMEADYQDYQALERKFSDPEKKQTALRDIYGNTYWYYYQYGDY